MLAGTCSPWSFSIQIWIDHDRSGNPSTPESLPSLQPKKSYLLATNAGSISSGLIGHDNSIESSIGTGAMRLPALAFYEFTPVFVCM